MEKLHTGEISVLELKSAEELWVQYEQGQILQSLTYEQVSQSLGLFRDDKDLLRLGVRLGNAHLPTDRIIQFYCVPTVILLSLLF